MTYTFFQSKIIIFVGSFPKQSPDYSYEFLHVPSSYNQKSSYAPNRIDAHRNINHRNGIKILKFPMSNEKLCVSSTTEGR